MDGPGHDRTAAESLKRGLQALGRRDALGLDAAFTDSVMRRIASESGATSVPDAHRFGVGGAAALAAASIVAALGIAGGHVGIRPAEATPAFASDLCSPALHAPPLPR